MTVFLTEPLAHLFESLDDNGQIALTVEEIPSHETYQFKGRYLRRRAVEPVDLEVVERTRERFVRGMHPIYPDVPLFILRSFTYKPSLAVEFEVREVYLQTPGPGAGARIFPPAES
jgi:hypothetical protein